VLLNNENQSFASVRNFHRTSQLTAEKQMPIHRFQKKPEVAPKRGLIALAVSGEYSKQHGERRGVVNLSSDDIPGVSVSEGKIEKLTPSQLRFSLRSCRIN